jgi:general secretion pathway protein A
MQSRATHRKPFAGRVLDDYFFATPALRLRLDLIQEHIRFGDAAVLILGAPGAGKSTLLNQLVCRFDHNWRVVRLPPVLSFSTGDVITFLNAELRLPTRVSIVEMLGEFDNWLDRLSVRGQTAVVVIDDAHDLFDESLAKLATLRDEIRSKNLCVLMTGEPELRTRMNALLGTTRSPNRIHAIDIPSLDQCEVASYIDMRLYHAGMEGKGPFSRATVDEIARDSRGYPGHINTMANDLLNGGRGRAQWQRASQCLRRMLTLSTRR